MSMQQVTNYTCDRCGRSEIADRVTILTLSVRHRAGKSIPGLGKSEISAHVCQEHCLKMIKHAMTPVQQSGRYDRKAAAERRTATKSATKPTSQDLAGKIAKKAQTKRQGTTKRATKKAPVPVSATQTALTVGSATDTRAETVRAVRAITRNPGGGYAKGYNPQRERRMIAERESINASQTTE